MFWKFKAGMPDDMNHLSDRELETRFAQGDARAFGVLMARTQQRLYAKYSQLARFFGYEAIDLIQDTYTRAWSSRASFDPAKGSFEHWVGRIAYNRLHDVRNRLSPLSGAACIDPGDLASFDDDEAGYGVQPRASGPLPDDCATAHEELRLALGLLASLGPHLMVVFLLAELLNCSYREVCELLDEPHSRVNNWLHRARQMMCASRDDMHESGARQRLTAALAANPLLSLLFHDCEADRLDRRAWMAHLANYYRTYRAPLT